VADGGTRGAGPPLERFISLTIYFPTPGFSQNSCHFHHPQNSKNRFTDHHTGSNMEDSRMTLKVQQCETVIGYNFNDKHLCWEALQAAGSGVFYIRLRRVPDGNKRLAIVGDIALNMALVPDWHASEAPKGFRPSWTFLFNSTAKSSGQATGTTSATRLARITTSGELDSCMASMLAIRQIRPTRSQSL